jgi:hypothetical protein
MPSGIANAGKEIDNINKSFAGMGSTFVAGFGGAVDTVGSAIISGVSAAAATAGGLLAASLTHVTSAGIEFNDTIEKATIGLATLQNMSVGISMEVGMRRASVAINQAQKDAQRLPGEFKDLVNFMSDLASPALAHGMSLDRIEKISSNAMAAAAAMNVPMAVASRQITRAFEGHMTSAMKFPQRLGLDKSINTMPVGARFDLIEKTLGKAAPSIDYFAASYTGLHSALADQFKQFSGNVTGQLFATLKGDMGRALDWFGAHTGATDNFAQNLGRGIERAYIFGRDTLLHWIPIAITFGRTLETAILSAFRAIEPYLQRFAGVAERFATNPNAGHMLGGAALALGGAKAASMGMDLGLEGLRAFGPLLSSAGVGLASLGPMAIGGAVAVAALGVGAYGAFDILTDGSNRWHDGAIESVESLKTNMSNLTLAAAKLEPAARGIADAYGAFVLFAADHYSSLAVGMSDDIKAHVAPIAEALDLLAKTLNPTKYTYTPTWEYTGGVHNIGGPGDDADSAGLTAKKPPNHVTNITNHVTVRVEPTSDPNRIARTIGDIMARDTRLGARQNPNAIFSR